MLFRPLKVCLGFSFSWLLDLFSLLWRKRKHKTKKLFSCGAAWLRVVAIFPGAVKQTTIKTGINPENCHTLSETGSWWWWSFRFDNTQRLSQLILSKRKHRDNSITTRKWALVGETRGAVTSVSPGEPSPSPWSGWVGARLRWVRNQGISEWEGSSWMGKVEDGKWWICRFWEFWNQEWMRFWKRKR